MTGWALLFHPDLLQGPPLDNLIKTYTFFDYHVQEALYLTQKEQILFTSLIQQIQYEIEGPSDVHHDTVIVGCIALLLLFCDRFYKRLFDVKPAKKDDRIIQFDTLLRDYFEQKKQFSMDFLPYNFSPNNLLFRPTTLAIL